MAKRWTAKGPDERLDYSIPFAKRLLVNGVSTGDALRTSTDPDPAKHPSAEVIYGDVNVASLAVSGTDLVVWVEGGTVPTLFKFTVWTTQNRKFTQTILLPVREP